MEKVTVYQFESDNPDNDKKNISRNMATLEWIAKQNFTPIMETAAKIDASLIEPDGLYRVTKK